VNKLLLTILLALVSTSAIAKGYLELKDVDVYSEDETKQMKECDINNAEAIASVQSALRYNRISIAENSDESKVHFHISITAANVSSDFCAAIVSLSVSTYGYVANSLLTHKGFQSEIRLCSQGILLTHKNSGIQAEINDTLRTATDICISKVQSIKTN